MLKKKSVKKVSQTGDYVLLDPTCFLLPNGHESLKKHESEFELRHEYYELFFSPEVK